MSKSTLCRCGQPAWMHDRLPANNFMPPCRNYTPMDFSPFNAELSGADGMGCHCDLCTALKYAVSVPPENWVPCCNALFDALTDGRHIHRSWDDWIALCTP